MKKDRLHNVIFLVLLALFFVFATTVTAKAESFRKTHYPDYDLSKDRVLHVVGYAHLDTQWRWTYQDTIRKYIPNTMRENFRLFKKFPNYVFNFTGARRYMMMKEYYPDDFKKVKKYIAKDRWFVCGSSVDECDTLVPSPESIIRHILYGNRYFRREFGKDSIDFMLPDCFGFPASLPSTLAHCGIKGFSTQKLTWGSAAGMPFNVGLWQGPDGRSVVAAINPGGYTHKLRGDLSNDKDWLQRIEKDAKISGTYLDYHYYGVGDRGGAPKDESVKWLERSIAGNGPVNVIAAAANQIYKDLEPEQIAKLPRYKGDLLLTEHSAGSLTSQAYMKRWNRKNELLADAAERASVIADWLGAVDYPSDKLTDAWYLVLGNQMHDILPGTSIPPAYEFSWNDEVIALNCFGSVLENAAGAVTGELDTRVKGIPIVVFNPLSIEREDIVEANVSFPEPLPEAVRVYGPDGRKVPSQTAGRQIGTVKVLFLAKVPSVGFTVYNIRPAKKGCTMPTALKVTTSTLENAHYLIQLNQNGDIASIKDKTADREVLSGPARLAFLKNDPNKWPAWNMDWEDRKLPPLGYVQGPAEIKIVESGPARVAIEVTRESEGSRFVQRIRLSAGQAGKRIEFDTEIDWRTKARCLKASFPLAVSNPKATYNMGLGTTQRGNNNPKKYEVPSQQWFDLTDTDSTYGVAVLEDCKYGSDKPDDNILRLTLLHTPKVRRWPKDQNTQDLGRHQMLYALAGHQGDWRQGNVPWQAARLNQPLLAFQVPVHTGKLGKSFSLLQVNNAQVAVKAIKKAEDSEQIIIRLQELHGKAAKNVQVSMASPIISAREVNGQEQTLGTATVRNGKLVFDMDAYHPRAFAVKLSNPDSKMSPPVCKPLDLAYDIDVVSFDSKKTDGDFDNQGRSIPGEMLPASIISEGITFKIGPTNPGRKNALTCTGQTIKLPSGNYNRLYLLAAAAEGDTVGRFKLDDEKIKLTVQDWTNYVGQWDNRVWQTSGNWRHENKVRYIQPGFIKSAKIAWFCSHRHLYNGRNDPYRYSYLFKYKIELPEGAKLLKLPKNKRIRILAMTAARNTNDAAFPAQPLYDTMEQLPRIFSSLR